MRLGVAGGLDFTKTDLWAIDAHMKLGRILIRPATSATNGSANCPLIVASIGGDTGLATQASMVARQPRNTDRRSTLANAHC